MSALIEAQGLTVVRRGKTILREVDISVGREGFITIIGPNGAGKSMLLKCLMGFYPPDSGTISRERGLKIGYVPQLFQADWAMPIAVERFLRLRKRVDEPSLRQAVEETDIARILANPLSALSGGELQRVLLARSLLNDPGLLVLDEPAQNLDISRQLGFYRLLERICAERRFSVLMVSHDLHMVMASTKEVICLYRHVCCSGEPQAVTRDPEFISLFGNDMANMMAVYQHSHDHTHIEGGSSA